MADSEFLLEIDRVTKSFGMFRALDNVTAGVKPNSVVGLIGPNGSGKSTLFNCVSGFLPFESGQVTYEGRRINGLAPYEVARRGLVRTFQMAKAPKAMTCLENMLLACGDKIGSEGIIESLLRRRAFKRSQTEYLDRSREMLDRLSILHVADEFAGNLSGGQQKLLSLARILIRDPRLILLDEPAAGVNPTLVNNFMRFINRQRDECGKTFLIVEHDMKFISKVCDYVFVLDQGRIISQGPPSIIQKDRKVLEVYLGVRRHEDA